MSPFRARLRVALPPAPGHASPPAPGHGTPVSDTSVSASARAARAPSRPPGRPRPVRALAVLAQAGLLAGLLSACGSSPASPSASGQPSPPPPAASTSAVVSSPSASAPSTPSAGTPAPATTAAGPGASSSSGPDASASSSPRPDEAAVLRTIAADVSTLRQLPWATPVEQRFLDEAELRRMLLADARKTGAAERMADVETLYRGLGAMEGGRSLEDLYLDALGSQVLGFYRDDDRTLYIVRRSGGLGPLEEYTAAHELTHALQDQRFGLNKLGLDATGQSDRALAALSLVEGDASLAGLYWMLAHLSGEDFARIAQAAADPIAAGALAALPPMAREELTFPYSQGLAFVMAIQTAGGWDAVDALYARPPASTEQVLHPDKYRSGEAPVAVELPGDLSKRLGAGWSLALEDTLGELGLRTWLAQANSKAGAEAAATGWGGDRIGLYRGPGGAWAIVLRTAWDDPASAARFTAAAGPVVAALPHAKLAARAGTGAGAGTAGTGTGTGTGVGAGGPVVLIGSDAAVLTKLEALAGR